MIKYIDAEKLKTWLENEADMEFKKTEENANSPVLCHFHNGCRMQALDTIDFITSLQQEQPEVDLDKEIEKFFDDCIPTYEVSLYGIKESVIEVGDYELIARHFYELGLNARNK